MKLKNPTEYFFEQAEKTQPLYKEKIDEFLKGMVDLKNCKLCGVPYDLAEHMPRILIHCGHTICTTCLAQFFRRGKVRCPLCLKLIRNLDGVEVIPVNHTIFRRLVDEFNRTSPDQLNADQELFRIFDYAQRIRAENQRIDRESGLPFCAVHTERVEHFICEFHKVMACRVCAESGHINKDCKIYDLYEVEDPLEFVRKHGINPPQMVPAQPTAVDPLGRMFNYDDEW